MSVNLCNYRRATSAATTLILSVLLSLAEVADSGTFQVNPIRITLSPNSSTSLLSVRNDSSEKVRFQIGVFTWDQSPQGEMVLQPTDDLIFYPTLLAVNPGDERKIRIGTANPVVTKEKSYRIFVEELPPLDKQESNGIRILTKMGVPIFIEPAKATLQGQIDGLKVSAAELSFEIRNTGNVHFFPRNITVKATGPRGESFLERQVQSWYILAGGLREFRIAIPRAECEKIHNLTVEAELEEKTLQVKLSLPSHACKG